MTTTPSTQNTIQDVTDALHVAEVVLPGMLSAVGAVYPPVAAFAKFLPLINTALQAVQIVSTATGANVTTATQVVNDHLTPNKSNAPALS